MEMIPIAGGALAALGLLMMAIGGIMVARGGKKQVKVDIPTSTPARAPLRPLAAKAEARTSEPAIPKPPPPPSPGPEPPAATPPRSAPVIPPPPPVLQVPNEEADSSAPTRPGDQQVPEPSEEDTKVSMLPAPETAAPPPPPASEGSTEPPDSEPTTEGDGAPQSTMAISPSDMQDLRTVVEHAPKSYGSLLGLSGGMEGREVKVDEEGFVIGRDQRTAQLVVSDPRISKRHVWIGVREGKVWAIDVGSTNGCYLNDSRSERITEVVLENGDILILSEDAARFEYRS